MLSLFLIPLLAAAPEPTSFLAVRANGEPVRGNVLKLAGTSVELRTPMGKVQVANLVSLRQVGKALPPFPTGPILITAAGDRVPGRILDGDDLGIDFQVALGSDNETTTWRVPYSATAVLWRTTPPADTPFDPAKYAWRGEERKDVLLFRNGDVLRGTFERMTADGHARVQSTGDATPRNHALNQLSAIAFNPALVRARKPKGPYAHVVLVGGTRLNVVDAAIDGGILTGKTLFGAPIRIRLVDLAALDILQGKATPLTSLKPKRVEQTDYLGVSRPPTTDRPVLLPTPHGDSTHDTGLTTVPRSRITYDLAGKYQRFEALVGLDARIREGSAVVEVLVDGKSVLREALTPGISRAIHVPLPRAKELTLAIDFGPSGGAQATVNWGSPKLIE